MDIIIMFRLLFILTIISTAESTITNNNRKPHIVIIIADDMGWNDVSFHGADQIPTPNIDALSYNGVILNRHYVLPTCTPSRVSLLTGRYAIREGLQGEPLGPGEPEGISLNVTLLPNYLRDFGYSTHLVGKWHVGYTTASYTPTRRGFDTFLGHYNGVTSYYNHSVYEVGTNKSSPYGHDLHQDNLESLKVKYDSKYITDLLTDEAERIIRQNGNEKPLFLEISHVAVHASQADDPLEVRNLTDVNKKFSYIKNDKRRKYAGMVQAMDESVGRVVKALSEAKMLDNSIIIFMTDNGAPTIGKYENTGSNHPLRGIKNTTFEGGVRGAACIFSPLIKFPSRVSNELMHITDWLPTLYAAAGGSVENIGEIDGLNLWPSIRLDEGSPRRSMLINIDEVAGVEAAIVGKHKLVKGAAAIDGYYGESGNDPSYPKYQVKSVLASNAGVAISNLNGFTSVTESKANKLREKSTVNCGNTKHYSNCLNLCMFDLEIDPCETKDLSKDNPKILQCLISFIDEYRTILKPQAKKFVDPCANPKYFGGNWMPWRVDGANYPDEKCQHPEYNFSNIIYNFK